MKTLAETVLELSSVKLHFAENLLLLTSFITKVEVCENLGWGSMCKGTFTRHCERILWTDDLPSNILCH